MKKILFIYSLVITIGLAIFFAFSNPSKATLIISFLMLPIPMYLFISLTNPKEISTPKWSLRILTIIFLLALFSVLSLKLLNLNFTGVKPKTDIPKTATSLPSPQPAKTESTKSNQDFTDILLEESK